MATPIQLKTGDTINGQYKIGKLLGKGSFGNVYNASGYDNEQYAVKLLRLWEVHPDIRKQLVDRFDMEFATGRINSPYLVHSLDHGLIEGNPYIVMEFCPGGDLISLSSREKLNYTKIALDVLCGLEALHAAGKVHRDLKPENVLRKADGTYALTDFGISGDRNNRMTQRNIMGKPKQIFGTYAYMPPEQVNPVRDATVLPTTDFFSFGVMMYQLLTNGILPFGRLESEKDVSAYLDNGNKGKWDRTILQNVPYGSQWLRLIESCLKPKFKDRPQSAKEAIQMVPALPDDILVRPKPSTPGFQTDIVNGVLLRVMQGEEYGKVYKLDDMLHGDRAILTLGRQDPYTKNDIAIKETMSKYISRNHCTLELDYDRGVWVIRDGQWIMGTGNNCWKTSTNGTFVNSSQASIDGLPVNPGDIVSVGDVKLRAEGY